EREVLLRMAPHIVQPLRFMLPQPGPRSPLLLRLGLFIYDRIGGRRLLPGTRTVDLTHHEVGQPLKRTFRYGFEYSDCAVDDARLVVLNALDATERGADIRTRARCVRAERRHDWELVLNRSGRREVATARVLINAAGPWIGQIAEHVIRVPLSSPVRLIRGSHIVVRRNFPHKYAYTLQAPDGRVVFALPFGDSFTLIGTTDRPFVGDVNSPAPDPEEISYLIKIVNSFFREELMPTDLVWSFAGVRSLHDDGSKKPEDVTRDYTLELDERYGEGPLLTVFGGKITTARRLAEAVMKKIGHFFQALPAWTADSHLPGGDFPVDELAAQVKRAGNRWPFLAESTARRMVQAYGTRIDRVLGDAKDSDDLGPSFGELTAAEVRYLMRHEWAQTADDVLWRRSKLGLVTADSDKTALAKFMSGTTSRG
ncbi:MAG: glycerol-3-phosphate dehydrogenase, partial [Pseudolabrys sp.]|nr:glycerol-3-phosphate dehydrogenase [Pseudolabrys sp.]